MATVTPYKNKDGDIVSYQIQVFRGRDSQGKKLKPYSMTWKVPPSYKSEKAIQKALEKVVGEFETSCKHGVISSSKRTMSQYTEYYLELCERNCKQKSVDFYKSMFPAIDAELGFIKLDQLTAEHLNRFYKTLSTGKYWKASKAVGNDRFIEYVRAHSLTPVELQSISGLSYNTARVAIKQQTISAESAQKIATTLNIDYDSYFDVVNPEKGYSEKTIRHYHNFIHAILEQAMKESCIYRNIADMATPPKLPKKEAEFYEIDEILKIKDALEDEPLKYHLMLYILIDIGCRRGELFGICWDLIDFEKNTIRIKNNIQRSTGKGLYVETPKNNDFRTLNISPAIITMLKTYRQQQEHDKRLRFSYIENDLERARAIRAYNTDGYLFIQDNGNVADPNSLNTWTRKFSKKVGFSVYPHKFRHSQASILFAAGVDLVTVSKRLGHKQVSTTQNIYAHLLEKSDKEASDKISNLLFADAK